MAHDLDLDGDECRVLKWLLDGFVEDVEEHPDDFPDVDCDSLEAAKVLQAKFEAVLDNIPDPAQQYLH